MFKMARSSSKVRDWPADYGKPLHFRLNLGSNFIQQLGRKIGQRSNGGHLNVIGTVLSVLPKTLLTYSCVGCIVVTVLPFSVFSVFRSLRDFVRVSGRAFGPILLSKI